MEVVSDDETDATLLDAIGDGNQRALAELYRRHAPWLTARLTRRCADADVVDQAVQDTFVAVWRKPDAYKGTGEVAAWLWGIAVRRWIDQLRRRPLLSYLPMLEPMMISAEDEVLVGLYGGDLAGALDSLSPELSLVVQATILDGLSTREAARLLGIPTGTVKSRASRARVQLREALT